MTAWIAILAGLLGGAAGVGVTAYFARMAVRHERRLAYLGFVASLKTLADSIGEDSDPRRVKASLRLKAEQAQRSADALKPDAGQDAAPVRPVGWGPFRLPGERRRLARAEEAARHVVRSPNNAKE